MEAAGVILFGLTAVVFPAAGYGVSVEQALTVIRPFWDGDARTMAQTFDRWSDPAFVPCKQNTVKALTRDRPDLILYYSKTIDRHYSSVLELMQPVLDATPTSHPWRGCFDRIVLLGANLTAYQDQYHVQHGAGDHTWNLGKHVSVPNNVSLLPMLARSARVHLHGFFFVLQAPIFSLPAFWIMSARSLVTRLVFFITWKVTVFRLHRTGLTF